MPFCFHQMHSCIPPCRFTFFYPKMSNASPSFNLSFDPEKEECHFSAWHSMEEKLSDRKHLHTSSFFNSNQPDYSPPYHPVELAGHLCCGNKASTAKQLQHISGRFSKHRFIHWAGCSTDTHLGGNEANPWCRTILHGGKGVRR